MALPCALLVQFLQVISGEKAVPSGREPVRMSCQLGLSQSSQPSKLLAARYIDLVSSEREPRDIPGVQVGGDPPMNVLDAKSSSNILECTRHAFRYCLAKVLHLFTERLLLRLHEVGLNLPEGLDILGLG